MYSIKRITAQEHDSSSSAGLSKFKVIVELEIIDLKAFKKLKGNLGDLVLSVSNEVYGLNKNIPAYYPTVDSKKRAKDGIKPIEFIYYFGSYARAEALGLKIKRLRNGEMYTEWNTRSVIFERSAA